MKFRITFAPEARGDYLSIPAYERAAVRDAINAHLLQNPARVSKSWIKRVRDVKTPQYRLRVGEVRVFYDVRGSEVEVLGIVEKRHAAQWLAGRTERS